MALLTNDEAIELVDSLASDNSDFTPLAWSVASDAAEETQKKLEGRQTIESDEVEELFSTILGEKCRAEQGADEMEETYNNLRHQWNSGTF